MLNKNQLILEDLDPDFKVILEPVPNLVTIPETFQNEVFNKALESKALFNGTLVCVKNFSQKLITTYTLSFKEFLAANHLPGYPHKHKPLAVSGWILHRDRVLLGVRSRQVLFFPGFLELVPSGGIDGRALSENGEVDYEQALIAEFEEETGMSSDVIERVTPETLVFCRSKSLFDICQSIHLDSSQEIDCDTCNEEYSKLFWVPLKELEEFILGQDRKIVPTSLALIKDKILS